MLSATIDLGTPFFWLFSAAALLILTPVTVRRPRRWLLAFINGVFIAIVAGAWGALVCGVAALALHHTARVRRRALGLPMAVAGATLVVLFVVHKIGAPALSLLPHAKGVLAAVSFSYVALRCVELLRAGADGEVSGSWIDTVNYIFPFHMLAAGPIQAYADFRRQPAALPALDTAGVLAAVDRVVTGLFKKFVLARAIELAFLTDFRASGSFYLLEVQMYYVWVYLDFSAYSDIAVGVGRLLGVATPENFNRPLLARNIVAFWERWHISLSQFIRRNIFIPVQLTLMRATMPDKPLAVASIAFVVTFVAAGLWHGVSWRFVGWGAMQALGLIVCNLYRYWMVGTFGHKGMSRYLQHPAFRVAATVVTFEFVAFSFAFIAADVPR